MTAPATGKDVIQSPIVAQGLRAVDQVRAAAPAMASVGVPAHVGLSGSDLQRQYDQWEPLDLRRLDEASALLNNIRTRLEELRAHADSTAGQLCSSWPDQAGQAAYGNYRQAAARAQSDTMKAGQFARALDVYKGSIAELLAQLREQAEIIFSHLLDSLGQYQSTGPILQSVRQIQTLIDQRPAPRNAQSLVDALRQQLQAQVAVPTEYAVTQFQRLLAMVQQQAGVATELLAGALQGVDTGPYQVPELPIACEPDRPDDCGCGDKKETDDGSARPAATSPEAGAAGSAPVPAGSGGGVGGGSVSGSGSTGKGGGPDDRDGKGKGEDSDRTGDDADKGGADKGGADKDDADKGGADKDDADKGGADKDDANKGEEAGKGDAPDMGFIGDIAKSIGDTISGLAGAVGQLGQGLAGAVGAALGGTDFSKLADDASPRNEAAADTGLFSDEAASDDDSGDDVGEEAGPEDGGVEDGIADGGVEESTGPAGDAGLDAEGEAPPDPAEMSEDVGSGPPDGAAFLAQTSDGPYVSGAVPGGTGSRSDPTVAGPAAQADHGEFEVQPNELKVPEPVADSEPGPQFRAVPPTTSVSAAPSTVPSF